MGSFKRIVLKDLKGDKAIKFGETVFRIILLVLALIGFFRDDFNEVYQGSLLFYALLALAISFIPNLVKKAMKVYITAEFRFVFLIYVFLAQALMDTIGNRLGLFV